MLNISDPQYKRIIILTFVIYLNLNKKKTSENFIFLQLMNCYFVITFLYIIAFSVFSFLVLNLC